MSAYSDSLEVSMGPGILDRLDKWRADQGGHVTRAEAVKSLVDKGLDQAGQPKFSDGEKLITLMLCKLFEHLKISGEFDTDFISSAIYGGHYWALEWDLQSIYPSQVDRLSAVNEVTDFLDMWRFLEEGYAALSEAEKANVEAATDGYGAPVNFPGFDGNNETEHMVIAKFLVEKMGRFERFGGNRSLNSHSEKIDQYRSMFAVFEPIRAKLIKRGLSADEIVAVLNARKNAY